VKEAVSQAISLVHAVVVAGYRVTGQQRMIDRLLVVAIVGRAGLLAVDLNRKAVHVDGHLPRGPVAAGGAEMTLARFAQRIA
jgi:hypothetical protein